MFGPNSVIKPREAQFLFETLVFENRTLVSVGESITRVFGAILLLNSIKKDVF